MEVGSGDTNKMMEGFFTDMVMEQAIKDKTEQLGEEEGEARAGFSESKQAEEGADPDKREKSDSEDEELDDAFMEQYKEQRLS